MSKSQPTARRHARHARCLRVKQCRACADDNGGDEQHPEATGSSKRRHAERHDHHGDGKPIGFGLEIARQAEQWLQQTGGDLLAECQQTNLQITQPVCLLQHRIKRREKELQQVVEQMGSAHCKNNGQGRTLRFGRRWGRNVGHGNASGQFALSYPGGRGRAIIVAQELGSRLLAHGLPMGAPQLSRMLPVFWRRTCQAKASSMRCGVCPPRATARSK